MMTSSENMKNMNKTSAPSNACRTLQKSKRKVQELDADPSVGTKQNGSSGIAPDQQGKETKKMKLDDDVSES
jgi:hypothetical protein